MPQHLGRRIERRLPRWHSATSTSIGLPFAAVAIAIAIVGALIFETGILARTSDRPASLDAADRAAAYLLLPAGGGTSGTRGGHTPAKLGSAALADSPVLLPGNGPAHPVSSMFIPPDPPVTGELTAADLAVPAVAPVSPPKKATPARHPKPTRPSRPATPSAPARAAWNVAPIVTWYGPGFYGNRTACGQRYTRTIIGVAHKTLPCGTLIQFRWHGITAMARVIDRGPYATSDYVFDFSAGLACNVFRPRGASTGCFTRHDVSWRVIGRRQN